MAKHLLLGGAGFLGRHVACQLALQREQVEVADRNALHAAVTEQYSVTGQVVDLLGLSIEDLRVLIGGFEVIHHYVWTSLPASANAAPMADLEDNVGFTLRLLAAAEGGSARIVFSSSGEPSTDMQRSCPFPKAPTSTPCPRTACPKSRPKNIAAIIGL
jgi:UDP-glucose 4-epimerase